MALVSEAPQRGEVSKEQAKELARKSPGTLSAGLLQLMLAAVPVVIAVAILYLFFG